MYLAGQVPDTAHASIQQQATEIITRTGTLLASAGVDKARLPTANIWLSDWRYSDAFNRVWDVLLPDSHAPRRACVQSLPMQTGLDVEITPTALVR